MCWLAEEGGQVPRDRIGSGGFFHPPDSLHMGGSGGRCHLPDVGEELDNVGRNHRPAAVDLLFVVGGVVDHVDKGFSRLVGHD